MIGDREVLTITSPYPKYCTKRFGNHKGVDFAARPGEKLKSLFAGEIVWLRHGKEGGKSSRVKIWPDGMKSFIYYVHCLPQVTAGQHVEFGEVLGECDLSGATTGGHLHYQATDLNESIIEPLHTITEADDTLKFQFLKGEWDGRTIEGITKELNLEGWEAIKGRMIE